MDQERQQAADAQSGRGGGQGQRSGPAIESPTISLPDGGSISGYGDVFEPNEQTGAGSYQFPIPLPEARGTAPQLSLNYASGARNGPFGVGFSVSVSSIERRTDNGVPRYDDTDEFVLDGAILVPRYVPDGEGGWSPDQRQETKKVDGVDVRFLVTGYLPRLVQSWNLIEHWQNEDTGRTYWRVVDANNTEIVLGVDDQSRIVDPRDPRREFRWLAQLSTDALGNLIEFSYLAENDENVPDTLGNAGRDHYADRYLAAVRYGNYLDEGDQTRFGFQVLFNYGQYDLGSLTQANPVIAPSQDWVGSRPDPFSTYRAGFEIRTYRRCESILLAHDFPDQLGYGPTLVGSIELTYDDSPAGTRVTSIRQIGYRLGTEVAYDPLPMPPVTLQYSSFASDKVTWGELEVAGDEFTGLLGDGLYRMVDLYGEGLPGVLLANENLFRYWRPLGEGRYANPVPLPQAPSEMRLDRQAYALQDINGGGRLDLVVGTATRGGFYGNCQDGEWQPFRSFNSYTPEYTDADNTLVDLDGSGLADLYCPADQAVRYYPGLGEEGFGGPQTRPTEVPMPEQDVRFGQRFVRFIDMFGDGLTCRVEVRGGAVTAWPNLGHGRFGQPVVFAGAPVLPAGLRMDRVLFADVTGNGYIDLLLVFPNRVELYPNESGNQFGEAITIASPFGVTDIDQVFIADVFGNGGSTLVISRPGNPTRHFYLDFTAGIRPGMLTATDNNSGSRTEIEYRSSTDYVLADRARRVEWAVRPANPIQVVSRITRVDDVGGTRVSRVFQYRDGYYDPVERRFLGFGSSQSQDCETFDNSLWLFPTRLSAPASQLADDDLPPLVQPAVTRKWSLIGTYTQWPELWADYQDGYWRGPSEQLNLTPFVYDDAIARGDAATQREAQVALSGSILRHEAFALNSDGQLDAAPMTVRENGFFVRLLQPRIDGHCAVFQVIEQQRAESQYDGLSEAPRIQHTVILDWDDYGNLTRTAHVSYGRRTVPANSPPSQADLQAFVDLDDYANVREPFHRMGVNYQSRRFDVNGIAPTTGRYFTVPELQVQVQEALDDTLPYGTLFTPGQRQAQTNGWWQAYFSDLATNQPLLPLGTTSKQGLIYNVPSAAMSQSLVNDLYDTSVVTDQLLEQEGGYQNLDDYWWNPGEAASYAGADKFYQLTSTRDPFGNVTQFGYDATNLAVISVADALGQTETAEVDYQAFQPWRMTNVNGIVSEVAYDPLGLVFVSSTYKWVGDKTIGDMPLADYKAKPLPTIASVLANPSDYLQGASGFFAYDLDSWRSQRTPMGSVALPRVDWYYTSDGQPAEPSRIRRQVGYVDGFGRQLSTKDAVDAAAIEVTEQPDSAGGHSELNGDGELLLWITSGRVQFNERGEAVRVYAPYVTPTPDFDPQPSSVFTRYSYDSQGRLVRTDSPKGFFSKTVYQPWATVEYDENDTVEDSSYYKTHIDDTNPSFAREHAALVQAAGDQNTPSTSYFNPRGQLIRMTRINIDRSGGLSEYDLVTDIWVDLNGNQIALADPRFYDPENPAVPTHCNFQNVYAMNDTLLQSVNADSGTVTDLRAADDRIIQRWNPFERRGSTEYDALRRETGKKVWTGANTWQYVQRIVYGDEPDLLNVNLPVEQYDDAGRSRTTKYDLTGNAAQADVQYRVNYDQPPDWNDPLTELLMPETWTRTWQYNALGEEQAEGNADGSTTVHHTYLNGWLKAVGLRPAGGGDEQQVVISLTYNALSGRRVLVQGGRVTSTFTYDDKTHRLIGIRTQRETDASVLQEYSYVYDPIGNLTSIADAAQPIAFFNNQQILPQRDYVYDAIYRLTSAKGRQQNDGGDLENYTRTYLYDKSSNLTQVKATADRGGFTRDFATSDSSNRSVPADWLGGGKTPDQFYDVAGNLLSLDQPAPDPELQTLSYDYVNRLSSCVIIPRREGDDDAAYFNYFADGMRGRKVLRKKTGGGTTEENTFYVGDLIVTRAAPQGTPATSEIVSLRLKAGDEMVLVTRAERPVGGGVETNRTDRYQLQNLIGSICIEVNDAGQVITYEEYYPFGGTAVSGGDAVDIDTKRYRFSGKELDRATGLYYYGHRYYSPFLARWLTADPAGPVEGPNLYAYANNNPTTFVDPTGLCPVTPDPRAYHMTLIDAQYRYLTPTEYAANIDLSWEIKQEVMKNNSLLLADENQTFSTTLQNNIVAKFSEFSGLFMTANPLMAQIWDEANSRLTNPSTTLDFRHDYSLTRSHMNKVMAEVTPEFDFSAGDKTFETHHLLLKSKHPELAVTTQNMVLSTRGSLSSGHVGLHEGLFHLLTAGQMGGLFSTEVAGVTGIIKRLIGSTQSLDVTDTTALSSSSFAWLELEDRSKGSVVPIWSANDSTKQTKSLAKGVTYTSTYKGSATIGVIPSAFQTSLQTQSTAFLSSGGSKATPMTF